MFQKSHHFTIRDSTFQVQVAAPTSRFQEIRVLRLGDVNIIRSVGQDKVKKTLLVPQHKYPASALTAPIRRHIYHAQIFPSSETFTVISYEGGSKEFIEEIAAPQYHFRHPSVLQVFGIIHPNISGIVYHDELITIKQALIQCPTHLSKTILSRVMELQNIAANSHLQETGMWNINRPWFNLTRGRLCIEILPIPKRYAWFGTRFPQVRNCPVHDRILTTSGCLTDLELIRAVSPIEILEALARELHSEAICYIQLPTPDTIWLGAVYLLEDPESQNILVNTLASFRTEAEPLEERETCTLLVNGQGYQSLVMSWAVCWHGRVAIPFAERWTIRESWLANSNQHMTKDILGEHYFLVTAMSIHIRILPHRDGKFTIQGTFMTDAPQDDLYLFLATPRVYKEDGIMAIQTSHMVPVFFWSFHPDGRSALTPQELDLVHPPRLVVDMKIYASSWSTEDYMLVREFVFNEGWPSLGSNFPKRDGLRVPIIHSSDSTGRGPQ
ncbi:hypothetical protein C8F01DRAFT_1295129 [Mycena amicta]|nr:hypothetical protein C8F01DRAFT_1295129 [Mycena amicta]